VEAMKSEFDKLDRNMQGANPCPDHRLRGVNMKLYEYNESEVEIVQETPYPAELVALALDLTMHNATDRVPPKLTEERAKFLVQAEHTSPFEHVVYTFLIQRVSRSLLAQLTRQRMSSFTSASQHYQEYSTYPCIVRDSANDDYRQLLDEAYNNYLLLKSRGEPNEEARQVLPNAAAVNILWTINARSLALFLRQRLCLRNVLEMQVFANKVHALAIEHFPELFLNIGPQCFMDTCKQGKMTCGDATWSYKRLKVLA